MRDVLTFFASAPTAGLPAIVLVAIEGLEVCLGFVGDAAAAAGAAGFGGSAGGDAGSSAGLFDSLDS